MCILMNDHDDDNYNNSTATTSLDASTTKRDGHKRWQFHTYRRWILRRKPLLLVAAVVSFLLLMGIFFMIIGAGIGSIGLKVVGGVLFGLGSIGLLVCFLIALHGFFFYGTRDQCVQTTDWTDEMTLDAAGYSSVGRPSALKSPDSTLKRNGTLGVKKVTLAPELGDYGVLPLNTQNNSSSNINNNNNISGNVNSINVVNNQPLHRLPSTGSGNTSRANSIPRTGYIDGSTVGTGGIKITPLDPNQPFPSPASSASYGGSGSGGQYYSTSMGGSTLSGSSATDTYAYPRSVQLSFDSGNSGSQYSTLRSIPVTHLGPGQKQSTSSYREVEYATVNKSGVNKPGNTVVRVEHLPTQSQHGSSLSSPQQGLMAHVHVTHNKSTASQGLMQNEDDRFRDYDNTIERSPVISTTRHQQQQQEGGNVSYHEKQMQFQRHQRNPSLQNQQDLHAPRQLNLYSLQKQYAPNPFTFQQPQQQSEQQHQEHQMQHYKMQYEQEKKQQQQQLQSQFGKSSAASSARNSMVDDVFEPQPLVYPSARRPMTFDQVTSSKMSVYDNVLANNLRESDEYGGQG